MTWIRAMNSSLFCWRNSIIFRKQSCHLQCLITLWTYKATLFALSLKTMHFQAKLLGLTFDIEVLVKCFNFYVICTGYKRILLERRAGWQQLPRSTAGSGGRSPPDVCWMWWSVLMQAGNTPVHIINSRGLSYTLAYFYTETHKEFVSRAFTTFLFWLTESLTDFNSQVTWQRSRHMFSLRTKIFKHFI